MEWKVDWSHVKNLTYLQQSFEIENLKLYVLDNSFG
jgi:hypothetical protein